ncbi:FprA family A-type flavoprotein [Fusobacterium sp. PH5-44]|uniref:FprA family A-type flavoprotein n=1 Tax=unclassified Fusobacterium TaxID=2648384 RepID=UPI003D23D9E9
MHNVRKVTDDLYWVGGDDHRLHLFENIHPIPKGVSYNSYLLMDKQTVLFDTVDWSIGRQFIHNINAVLDGRDLDYLIVNHMEPDHAAMIEEIVLRYPKVKVVSNEKAFYLMSQFEFHINPENKVEVKEGDQLSFGKHNITFVAAPMVHWPEAMVSFDTTNGVLFSADAFGSFGALDGKLFNDEMNFDRDWIDEARRYYTNIVGKYGPHVQALLKKAGTIDIKLICPLHGPVWRNNFAYFLKKYDQWSKYEPEVKGVLIIYASMYGNTENACSLLASKLVEKGIHNIVMYDVSKTPVSYLISETFKYSHIVLASVTYNLGIYPLMHNYLIDIKALNLQNRTFAILENGSWACKSGSLMREELESMKNMAIIDQQVTLTSSFNENNVDEMNNMVDELYESINKAK